jgi:hypothetical protein
MRHINLNIIKKNTEAQAHASNEAGLKVNVGKTKYMFMSPHQTTQQNNYINVANEPLKMCPKLEYLGMTLTNQICIHKEIKCRLNMGNACY